MDKRELFLNKFCKLVKANDYCLFGTVVDIDDHGVMFQTKQRTSFISWTEIKQIVPRDDCKNQGGAP